MKQKGNNIGWCDKTANPVTGCPNGCEYCYARGMNERFHWVEDFSKPQFFPNRLKEFRTREPMIIFIDSMSDIGAWEYTWQSRVIAAISENSQNIYLALTKCYDKIMSLRLWIAEFDKIGGSPLPLFIGATVTDNQQAKAVIASGGADFISFEPLMESINPDLLSALQCKWWIVGDMTDAGKPQLVTKTEWVEEVVSVSKEFEIPLFMKDSLIGRIEIIKQFPKGWKNE